MSYLDNIPEKEKERMCAEYEAQKKRMKRCPFCNGPPTLSSHNVIFCNDCMCQTTSSDDFEVSLARWNTRLGE